MTLTASLLLDIVILLLLVLFFVQGIRRGFILTLCSLLAVFLALAGGWFLAHEYAEPLQEKLEPVILERLVPARSDDTEGLEDASLVDSLHAQMENAAQSVQDALLTQQAKAVSAVAARAILFLAGFLAVLLIWVVVCHALDLVAKLPGLRLINKAMGGVLGLVKGLILLIVLRWLLCDLLNMIPSEVQQESYLLPVLDYLTVFSLPGR